ncbi:MAG: single-stranded DNA-binding protein [Acholeplasmataceae bacterium]|nr:single-stranded DNA-binding protein [Acholeplasmataceae bacterium]
MLNNVMLIGRLTHDPQLKILEDGKKVLDIQMAVQRSFKNMDGIYETDFITVTLWQGLAENLNEYCEKGSLIVLRGRLQVRHVKYDDKDYRTLEVIGERVNFLGSKKEATVSQEEDFS